MIVFKTFLKVLNKSKVPIIIYTVMLIFFGGFNMQTSDHGTTFIESKPDVYIVNHDEEVGITKNLIDYFKKQTNIIKLKDDQESLSDALFYREVNYIIYLPKGFHQDFLAHKNPTIEVKSTNDYQASLASMMLENYLKVANTYLELTKDEKTLIDNITSTLEKEATVELTSTLDTTLLTKASFFYNFSNYCLLAGTIYIIGLILYSFNQEKIKKRTIISSMNMKKYNRLLWLSNGLFAIVLWAFYVLLSFILIQDVMFSLHGLVYILNSFVFTLCSVSLAFLLGNLLNSKNALNGIINVVALGSSFLCGAFVPMEWLPDFVIKIAHILPSYWYIHSNELTKTLEVVNLETLTPILFNMGILLGFSLLFLIFTNVLTKRKRVLS